MSTVQVNNKRHSPNWFRIHYRIQVSTSCVGLLPLSVSKQTQHRLSRRSQPSCRCINDSTHTRHVKYMHFKSASILSVHQNYIHESLFHHSGHCSCQTIPSELQMHMARRAISHQIGHQSNTKSSFIPLHSPPQNTKLDWQRYWIGANLAGVVHRMRTIAPGRSTLFRKGRMARTGGRSPCSPMLAIAPTNPCTQTPALFRKRQVPTPVSRPWPQELPSPILRIPQSSLGFRDSLQKQSFFFFSVSSSSSASCAILCLSTVSLDRLLHWMKSWWMNRSSGGVSSAGHAGISRP